MPIKAVALRFPLLFTQTSSRFCEVFVYYNDGKYTTLEWITICIVPKASMIIT